MAHRHSGAPSVHLPLSMLLEHDDACVAINLVDEPPGLHPGSALGVAGGGPHLVAPPLAMLSG